MYAERVPPKLDPLFWPRTLALLPRGFTVVGFDAAAVVSNVSRTTAMANTRALRVQTEAGVVVVFGWRLVRIVNAHPTPTRAAHALARQVRRAQRGVETAGVVPADVLAAADAVDARERWGLVRRSVV